MTTATKPPTIGLLEAGRLFGIGQNTSYRLAKREGELVPGVPVLKVGKQLRVPTSAIEQALGIDVADFLSEREMHW